MTESSAVHNDNRIKQIQTYISRMPSLSTTVTKVLEICNSPNTSPNDLNRVISLDPVLTGKVLRLINSAYYSLTTQVSSLTRAIIMLGLNTVKNLALSTAVLDTIGDSESFRALDMDNFWTHSICVGVTAKALATRKAVPVAQREEYFVAGLLHDLGKVPLNNRFPEDYVHALELTGPGIQSLSLSESMVFGLDHAEVGSMIADKWKLSEVMKDCLRYHHHPKAAEEDNQSFVSIVSLANACTNKLEIGSAGDITLEQADFDGLLEAVGVDFQVFTELHETITDEIEKAKIFLQMTKKG